MSEPVSASDNQRRQRLAMAVQNEVVAGGRVEVQGDYNAVIRHGKSRNHVLHIILTVITAGIWLLVYVPLLFINRPATVTLNVDEFGNLLRQKV